MPDPLVRIYLACMIGKFRTLYIIWQKRDSNLKVEFFLLDLVGFSLEKYLFLSTRWFPFDSRVSQYSPHNCQRTICNMTIDNYVPTQTKKGETFKSFNKVKPKVYQWKRWFWEFVWNMTYAGHRFSSWMPNWALNRSQKSTKQN